MPRATATVRYTVGLTMSGAELAQLHQALVRRYGASAVNARLDGVRPPTRTDRARELMAWYVDEALQNQWLAVQHELAKEAQDG